MLQKLAINWYSIEICFDDGGVAKFAPGAVCNSVTVKLVLPATAVHGSRMRRPVGQTVREKENNRCSNLDGPCQVPGDNSPHYR